MEWEKMVQGRKEQVWGGGDGRDGDVDVEVEDGSVCIG